MRRIALWSLLFVAGALSSLSAAGAFAQALEKQKVTLAVGGKTLFYYLPLTIAERKGYFKDEGLDVQIVDFPGGAKSLEALIGGSADVVSGAYEHTINMQARGQPIVAIALQGRYNGIVLAVNKSKAAQVKSVKDLKGMKVGVTAPGSSTNMMVSSLLAKSGLRPDDVSFIGVDAISNLDPVINKLETDGDVQVLIDTRTAKGMKEVYGGDYHAGCIYVTAAWLKKNPNTAQAIVNAMVRADLWLQKARVDDIVATVPPEYYGADVSLYKVALYKNQEGFSPDGLFTMKGAQNVYAVLKAFEPSVQKAKIDLAATFDNGFVQKALKKYRKD